MSFKPDKCSILRFSTRKHVLEYSYRLSGQTIQALHQHKHLGVTLSTDLKWNPHVDRVVNKANGMLGFVRRNLGNAPRNVKIQAYKGLIRPHVEYCSSVWDPHTNCNIKKVEAFQRRAARFITNNYSRESSVSAILNEINLQPLQRRRQVNRLMMLHKIVPKKIDLKLEDHIEYSKRPNSARCTRNNNPLTIKVPMAKTNRFQSSFFHNTVRDWNALPFSTTSTTITKTFSKLIHD
ncbi:uncharacterized protein [Antedon mediterranea]|uniref:uncharacterized protein n=1 Tax=Antedon mediterranea TaxID=105859 RepID=UPI003AF4ECA9